MSHQRNLKLIASEFEKTGPRRTGQERAGEIESATPQAPWRSVLPEGASLYSGLVINHRFTSSIGRVRSCKQIHASRTAFNPNGLNADAIAEGMFAGAKSAVDVLRDHTPFGFYSRVLDERVAARWASKLSGAAGRGVAPFLKSQGVASPTAMSRWCPSCASGDAESTGLPLWRVVHQLPFMTHCTDHLEPLVGCCATCGIAFDSGGDFRLPTEACRACGGTVPLRCDRQLSVGMASFTRLCGETFRSAPSELRPRNWALIMRSAASRFGGAERLSERLTADILLRWEVASIREVSKVLEREMAEDFVLKETRLLAKPADILPRLIVLDALRHVSGEIVLPTDLAHTQRRANELPVSTSLRDAGLDDAAFSSGVAVGIVTLLLNGATIRNAAREACLSTHLLSRFLKRLPGDQQAAILSSDRLDDKRYAAWLRVRNRRPHGSIDAKRTAYRAMIEASVASHCGLTRTRASKLCGAAVAWLRENDSAWLDRELPATKTQLSRKARSEGYRKVVERLIESSRPEHPVTVESVRRKCPGAVRWLGTYDTEWFRERVLPTPRRRNRMAG